METAFGLDRLVASKGARKAKKRLGRGESSGHGKTCGRGNKGQKARKSGNVRPGFEGGQSPLIRRLPKRGFKNFDFRANFSVVNVGALASFPQGVALEPASLVASGLIRHAQSPIKLLGNGELEHVVHVYVHAASASAREKIEKLGGSVTLIGNS